MISPPSSVVKRRGAKEVQAVYLQERAKSLLQALERPCLDGFYSEPRSSRLLLRPAAPDLAGSL